MPISDESMLLLDVVMEFYQCENARDWDGVSARVSPDIVSQSFPSGKTVSGKTAYLNAMVEMYRGRAETFTVLSISADAKALTVHAELIIEDKLSVNVFEICEGLIVREREYLGLGYNKT